MASFGEVVEKLRRATVQVRAHRNGSGSGVIWSQDGQIATNAHVVEGARNPGAVEVELWDGRRVAGKIVRIDRRRDVAVLQVEASGLEAATIGDANRLRVGELVVAVGNPLGFTGAASTGVVHRLDRIENRWVVSQLRLAPGNSGGPLANGHGEVVGINTLVAGGLAFAIPAQSVAEFVAGPHKRQWGLGVVVQPVALGQQLGFVVLEVTPDSSADRASLLQGDILVGARGKGFSSMPDLELAIYASQGGTLALQFRRGASQKVRTVTLQMPSVPVKAA